MEAPKHTGNPLVDGFNDMTYPLKFGGETAQKQWDGLKGQPLELGGVVDSVEKGTEAGTYLVRIDILDQSKATPGVYDIEVKDSKQPNVKNLAAGRRRQFQRHGGLLHCHAQRGVDGSRRSYPARPAA